MRYAPPGTPGALLSLQARYENFIGGKFVPPVEGRYFINTSPVTGAVVGEFPRSNGADIELALDAAHAAAAKWGKDVRTGALPNSVADRRPARIATGALRCRGNVG